MGGYKWVACNGQRSIESGMISVGKDMDGMHLVVGRTSHGGDILPAKAKPQKGIAYVSHGCKEHVKHHFEIFMTEGNSTFRWTHAANGDVPHGAVVGGKTVQGEDLYVGRVTHNGVPCIGKVHRSQGVLYVPFAGNEISFREYDVLVH